VLIFDVTPYRTSIHSSLFYPREYYTAENGIDFLKGIVDVCKELGLVAAMKFKRPLGGAAHFDSRYLKAVDDMVSSGNLKLVAPDESAQHYIKSAKMVVSRPFTSTAYMAKQCRLPSVFFDASGITAGDDESAAGMPILTNIDDLRSWITENMKTASLGYNSVFARQLS
jgi:polysaccharide biosynthesis PFTS motif protein